MKESAGSSCQHLGKTEAVFEAQDADVNVRLCSDCEVRYETLSSEDIDAIYRVSPVGSI